MCSDQELRGVYEWKQHEFIIVSHQSAQVKLTLICVVMEQGFFNDNSEVRLINFIFNHLCFLSHCLHLTFCTYRI
ncbi:hypothetical protein L2E82_06076 [Cichorium intybus]|uniref:Uncharacterized protein n=1 Tax=Cichorium intybus TaxID=13427 RepID=A0ACB9H8L2_CICIN|nr:hypothetical protein L2E82_06076 [Cichorium intybus]